MISTLMATMEGIQKRLNIKISDTEARSKIDWKETFKNIQSLLKD